LRIKQGPIGIQYWVVGVLLNTWGY
jgi:hypothetical protein